MFSMVKCKLHVNVKMMHAYSALITLNPVCPSIPLCSEKNVNFIEVAELWTHKAKADVDSGLDPINTY